MLLPLFGLTIIYFLTVKYNIDLGSLLRCVRETEHSAMAKRLQPIFREVVREVLQELREMDREASSSREAAAERAPSARPNSPATPGGHVNRKPSQSAETCRRGFEIYS